MQTTPSIPSKDPRMEAIVAVARNGVIGLENKLPWRLKSDLMRFRKITMGHVLVMGRKTFDSIGKPLPGRQTVVLTRNQKLTIAGCSVAQGIHEAQVQFPQDQKLFIVGGAEIYRQSAGLCSVIHITHVLADAPGDAFWTPLDLDGFRCTDQIYLPADLENDWPTLYERWQWELSPPS